MKTNFAIFTAFLFAVTSCKNETPTHVPAAAPVVVAPTPVAPVPSTTCYLNVLNKDTTVIQLTIDGKNVTGFMTWQPYQKDGARGSLTGLIDSNVVTADFLYMIEGSIQIEEIMLQMQPDYLMKANNPIEEVKNRLVIKDKTKLKWEEKFMKTACTVVEKQITAATETMSFIQARLKEK
jgi:hypothetical protein